jgi:hypothetical protein
VNVVLEKPPPPPLVARQLLSLLNEGQLDPNRPDQLSAVADAAEAPWVWVVRKQTPARGSGHVASLFSRPHERFLTEVRVQSAESVDVTAETLAGQIRMVHRKPIAEIEKSDEQVDATPFYKTWWFWTVVGVAAAGGATATTVLLWPEGETRYRVEFTP